MRINVRGHRKARKGIDLARLQQQEIQLKNHNFRRPPQTGVAEEDSS